jgi:hypothetical protein
MTVSPSTIRRRGVDHRGDVEHPFLEQIPGPFGMILYEPHGIARFDVLGQDQADFSQQPDDPLPGEHDVFGHDYPHGICVPIHVGLTVRRPSRWETDTAA